FSVPSPSSPHSPLLPYTTLFRSPPPEKLSSRQIVFLYKEMFQLLEAYYFYPEFPPNLPTEIKYRLLYKHWDRKHIFTGEGTVHIDRKSTRLNSSHVSISYAVFCL